MSGHAARGIPERSRCEKKGRVNEGEVLECESGPVTIGPPWQCG